MIAGTAERSQNARWAPAGPIPAGDAVRVGSDPLPRREHNRAGPRHEGDSQQQPSGGDRVAAQQSERREFNEPLTRLSGLTSQKLAHDVAGFGEVVGLNQASDPRVVERADAMRPHVEPNQ